MFHRGADVITRDRGEGGGKILELREAKGDLELKDLSQVPYLRLTPQLVKCLHFTHFEDKEGLGSLYERHRERVRSVDQLVEKWEGTGPGHAIGMGRIGVNSTKSHPQGESPIIVSRKGTGGNSQSPERFEDEHSELEAAFIERLTPGTIKVTISSKNAS